jgi:hypothetical protein
MVKERNDQAEREPEREARLKPSGKSLRVYPNPRRKNWRQGAHIGMIALTDRSRRKRREAYVNDRIRRLGCLWGL